jgi:hypothetical protein
MRRKKLLRVALWCANFLLVGGLLAKIGATYPNIDRGDRINYSDVNVASVIVLFALLAVIVIEIALRRKPA